MDGSKQFIGWYDSLRKENCGFQTAADGMMRCLPGGIAVSPGSVSTPIYADAGCTVLISRTPAIQNGCPLPVPSYGVTSSDSTTCGQPLLHIQTVQPATLAMAPDGGAVERLR